MKPCESCANVLDVSLSSVDYGMAGTIHHPQCDIFTCRISEYIEERLFLKDSCNDYIDYSTLTLEEIKQMLFDNSYAILINEVHDKEFLLVQSMKNLEEFLLDERRW